MATKDEIRAAIFQNAKPSSLIIQFFGQEIEIRQPTVAAIFEAQQLEDRSRAAAQMLVQYAYVPGTQDRLFNVVDIDQIVKMPFGPDMARVNDAISKLTDIDFKEEAKNSEETPSDST